MLRRLARETNASVILEFAIALPLLLTLYIGSYTVTDLIACNRKLGVAARTLADLLARGQSPGAITASPSTFNATSYMNAAVITLTPYGVARATEDVALLRICDATHAYVVWSQAQTQDGAGTVTATTPTETAGKLSAASVVPIPSTLIPAGSPFIPVSPDGSNVCTNYAASTSTTTQVGTAGGYMYIGQVSYTYMPSYTYGFTSVIPLSYYVYMVPRLT
ncbi:TadE/TadG family type IV pilus assembly protein [Novosphingobium sp.]|uniref:TadE/TadG family type IV pilus assembly protein n=1 Tax=Novosphingobium sp. TaxID=1874826 RepID=UPI003B527474